MRISIIVCLLSVLFCVCVVGGTVAETDYVPETPAVDYSNPYYAVWFDSDLSYEDKLAEFDTLAGKYWHDLFEQLPETVDDDNYLDLLSIYNEWKSGNLDFDTATDFEKIIIGNFHYYDTPTISNAQRNVYNEYDIDKFLYVPSSDAIQHDIDYGLVQSPLPDKPEERQYYFEIPTLPQEESTPVQETHLSVSGYF